jgi:protein N-terminal amidase
MRLKPLWDDASSDFESQTSSEDTAGDTHESTRSKSPVGNMGNEETIVIVCNRCGEENGESGARAPLVIALIASHVGYTYAGTSAIFRFSKGKHDIIGVMKRKEEGVRIWTIE